MFLFYTVEKNHFKTHWKQNLFVKPNYSINETLIQQTYYSTILQSKFGNTFICFQFDYLIIFCQSSKLLSLLPLLYLIPCRLVM